MQKTKLIDQIIVSTDDKKIAKTAAKYESSFIRPKNFPKIYQQQKSV